MFLRCSFILLPLILLCARTSGAQKRDPVTAEQLFEEGRVALEQRNYAKACKKFEESDRLDPAAGTLMNRATCEERRGRIATAWQLWQEALDRLQPSDDRLDYARAQARSLEARIPRLTIKPAVPLGRDVEVYRDGVRLRDGALRVALRVDPGSHVVLVRRTGYADQRYRIDLVEHEQREIAISVGARLPASPPEASAGAPTWGYILTGVGVAAMGGAVATHFLIADKKETVAENCPNKRCNQQGYDAVQDGKTLLIANRLAWGVGGTAFAGGIALLLFGSGSPGEEQRVGLVLAPNRLGIVHSGRF